MPRTSEGQTFQTHNMPSPSRTSKRARVLKPHYQRHVLRSRSHEVGHAGKNDLIESAGLAHKRRPCITVVSVEVSKTALLRCCLLHEEDTNARPSSVDDRSSDHMAREPSTLLPDLEVHHGYFRPRMPFHA
jgi:hypothetical protein